MENHSIIGGLGSAVAEILLEENVHPLFHRMGIRDRFGETATLEWLLESHGLSTPHIVKTSEEMIAEKKERKKI